MRSHAAAAALLATLLLMTGCASTPAAEEASGPPVMGYLERVKARVAAATARSMSAFLPAEAWM